jgi:uncharacterized membrane protein YfcA
MATTDLFTLIYKSQNLLKILIPLLISVMVIWFIWTVVQYSMTTEEEKKKKAKKGIINALIGVFIVVSFWGIIAVIQNTTDVSNRVNPNMYTIPTPVTP